MRKIPAFLFLIRFGLLSSVSSWSGSGPLSGTKYNVSILTDDAASGRGGERRTASREFLSITDIIGVGEVAPDTLTILAEAVFAESDAAQGVLISCGGLKTLDILEALEARLGVPVISSSPAGFWDAVQLVNVDPLAHGSGQLFRRRSSTALSEAANL